MLSLSDKHVERFQELYLARFGMRINKEEAATKGAKLLHEIETILRQNERSRRLGKTENAIKNKSHKP